MGRSVSASHRKLLNKPAQLPVMVLRRTNSASPAQDLRCADLLDR